MNAAVILISYAHIDSQYRPNTRRFVPLSVLAGRVNKLDASVDFQLRILTKPKRQIVLGANCLGVGAKCPGGEASGNQLKVGR